MLNFCAYFDHNYLPRALALYESLKKHCPEARLFVLCMSRECREILEEMALPEVTLYGLEELEAYDPELLAVKNTRKTVEYYFTTSPCWPRFLLRKHPEIDILTYVDADCLFFSDPSPVLAELGDASVGIVPHRFSARMREAERYGKYNVGWQTFRNNAEGLRCLEWWRERCLEWCHDYIDGERYADQKYLDRFTEFFDTVVIKNEGVNVAPWNLENYKLRFSGEEISLNGVPLVFYHFQGVRNVIGPLWDLGLKPYGLKGAKDVVNGLYRPYVRAVLRHSAALPRKPGPGTLRMRKRAMLRRYNPFFVIKTLLNRQLVLVFGKG